METRRITFYADDDVWKVLQHKGRGERGDYLNAAVRRSERPPYRFVVPHSAAEASLEPMLSGARYEIVAIGITLRNLVQRHGTLLQKKVAERTGVTVIVINPSISDGDPVYELLRRETGAKAFADCMVAQAKEVLCFFQALREVGLSNGTRVRLLTCDEVPRCGAVITDHHRTGAKMRVSIYSSLVPDRPHPFIDIDPQVEGGGWAYDSYYDYYDELENRSKEIPAE